MGLLVVNNMKVSVLSEPIQATQLIAFGFDQSSIPHDQQVNFQLYSWTELTQLDKHSRYKRLFDCDYLILSRWYDPKHFLEIVTQARRYNKKFFLHLDDNLFSVPKSIGINKWRHYSSTRMLEALYATAELSDGIIASTNRLSQELYSFIPQAKILACPYWKHFDYKSSIGNNIPRRVYPVIGYMGTQTHVADLDLITPDLDYLMYRNPSLVFETFGIQMPEVLSAKYPNRCSTLNKIDGYKQFQSFLSSLGWWIGLAPLTESHFNSCKTNTKFIEYIHAGIPVIASNFGPYENTPTINHDLSDRQQHAWVTKIEMALFSNARRALLYEQQREYCKQYSDPSLLTNFYRSILT